MINQLRYVTRKLQGQTLNEAPENGGKVGSEDRDSGTESDDEQPYDDPEPGTCHPGPQHPAPITLPPHTPSCPRYPAVPSTPMNTASSFPSEVFGV